MKVWVANLVFPLEGQYVTGVYCSHTEACIGVVDAAKKEGHDTSEYSWVGLNFTRRDDHSSYFTLKEFEVEGDPND